MNLQPISSGPRCSITCVKCGVVFCADDDGGMADLDGLAFRAYYCPRCADVAEAELVRLECEAERAALDADEG